MLKTTIKTLFTLILLLQFTTVNAQQPNDCSNAITVCGDSDVVLDVNGGGAIQELAGHIDCIANPQENNSLWLEVTVVTNGTLAFTLTPGSTAITEDYDFFIFGPNVTCGNLGQSIRCSSTNPQGAGQGNNLTGLNTTETDTSEGPGTDGNSFLSAINATAGETYFLVIDRPIGNSNFSLTWTGTAQFSDAPTSDLDPNGGALNLTICDAVAPFNDGQTPFDLEENTPIIIGSQTDVAVAYYENESDANIGVNPITSPYTSTNNGQTIFATITNTTTSCFTIQEFDLIVTNNTTITTPPNMEICDDDNDGFWDFDLIAFDSTVLGTQSAADFTVSYHNSQADADNGLNALPDLYPNQVANQLETIFVRIENNSNTACNAVTSFTINVEDSPIANPVPNQLICDDNNDGLWTFELTDLNSTVLVGQQSSQFNVTYHISSTDADNNTNAITSPYTNQVAYQAETLYVRIENIDNTVCFDVSNFIIDVFDQPSTNAINYSECDDANDGDDTNGFTTFDLSTLSTQVYGTQNTTQFDLSYFFNQTDADANINPIPNPTNYIITTVNTEDIIVRLENIDNLLCYSTAVVTLVVNSLPIVQNANLVQCDEDGNPDGFTEFNLNEANENVMVNGDTTNYIYTHHLNLTDAENGINDVTPVPFTNTSSLQDVYVRIEDATTGCFRTAIYTLDVTATDIGDAGLNACDDNYDGFTEFTLSDADATILATLPPGLNVDYYATINDAQLEINQLPNLYTNTTAFTQTIYIRVENANDCFGIANMDLNVDSLPENNLVNNLTVCSDTPNMTSINLDQFDAEVLGAQNPANYTLDYFETQNNADNNTNALTSPYTNSSNPQPLFVRIENNTTGCFTTTINFNITVNINPIAVDPTPLVVCDDNIIDGMTAIDLTIKNNEISGGNPVYAVTYYFDQANAEAETNPLPSVYTNTTADMQTILVRVEDVNTGCFDITSLELVVEQAPTAFTPTALEHCDPDSDGFGAFMLSDTETEITGGAAGLVVTYHETMADAQNNVNALTSPYNNIVVNTQTIYVRVESLTITTDCATFVNLTLTVSPTPQITTAANLTPLEVCDNDDDGFAVFNLSDKEDEILNLLDTDTANDLDPTLYTITYYENLTNAETPTNAIATPNAYLNTIMDMQTIWVRVEDDITACYKTVALDLIVNPLPVLVQPLPLVLCDVNNPGDEVEAFTLEDANAQILNGQNGISLTYFSTQLGADTNDVAVEIASPYTNTVNSQTIYVRATDNITGCVSTITLDLRVNPLPSPATPAPLEACDEDNDGFYDFFNLDSQSAIIENGEPNVTTTYYETPDDAMNMTNPLASPYANIVANQQTIHVLVTNNTTGCFTIVTMDLVVLPSPVVPIDIEDYVVCDDDDNGFNQFDFDTEITPQILTGGQTAADFTLTYHLTQAQADTGNNPIVNTSNYTNISNPQTIYIRLVSNTNGCVTTTGSFDIEVKFPPVLDPNYDNDLTQCDDLDADYMEANNGITSFDLTVEDIEITGPTNVSWIVTYYETLADAQADTNAIPDPTAYTNTMAGPQTLYVRVTDNDTSCFSFTTVTIRVIPNPSPSPNPVDLELCDDNAIVGANDLLEVFDLTENEDFIINNEAGVTASYYITQDDAIMGNNAIVDPTVHTNEDPANPGVAITPQTIYVRLTNGTDPTGLAGTGCYSLVSFDVIVNPLPVVTPVDDYIICELNTDDVADFDLTSMTDAILNGQNPAVFTVTYHETQAEADTAMNDLTASGDYTNTSDPQTIYVNITNTITGCNTAVLNFDLRVDEAALANPIGGPITYITCDDTMEFDNNTSNDMTAFDLATQNDFALDGQDATSYTVTYYSNQIDADAATNPLPFTYTNTVNPQVIIVRVDNDIIEVGTLAIDLVALGTTGIDFDNDGDIDTLDTDGDGVFDLIDTTGDGLSNGTDTTGDGLIDQVDIDGDGIADYVDLDGDNVIDNEQDSSTCYDTAEITLQVNPMPSFTLEAEYLLCINTNGTEVINSPILDTGLNATLYTFEWFLEGAPLPGQIGSSIAPTSGGTYSVIATDIVTGCPSILVDTFVTVSEPPVIAAEVTTLAFADQHDIAVTATASDPTNNSIAIYEFSLDGGSWETNEPNDSMYTFTNVSAGHHTITVRDMVGCGETTTTIMVMDYPHYFTPNGDGYNDTWNIYAIGNQPDAVIYIFDRYGKLLKQLSPTGAGWNGTYNGNPVPTSDYWFTLEYREPGTDVKKSMKAHFTLKR